MTLAEIGSIAAVIVSLYGIFANRGKVKADSADINTRANISLLAPLTQRVDELEREAAEWRAEREEWKIGIGLLLGQLVEARIKPTWTPRGVPIPEAKSGGGGDIMGRKR